MKFYIPFGDWSDDGHGKYEKVLVEAPSMEGLLEAEKKIKAKYGDNFFDEFANEYEDSHISENVKRALEENCPEFTLNGDEYGYELNEIIDFFIALLNVFGANITKSEENDYPMICNWTCRGFETVGYGCFYD